MAQPGKFNPKGEDWIVRTIADLERSLRELKAKMMTGMTWEALADKPAAYDPASHKHPATDITDATTTGRSVLTATDAAAARSAIGAGTSSLVVGPGATDAMAGNKTFAATVHTHVWADLTDKPATFPPTVGTTSATAKAGDYVPVWSEVTGKPSTFPPSAHTHLWAELTDKPATFAPSGHRHPWADLDSVPSTFPPSAHGHAFTEITGAATPAQLPVATSSAAGSMSAADKTKLDGATNAATPSTLAFRSATGNIGVVTGSSASDAASKSYVDKLGVFRAAGTVTVPVLAAGATTTVTITFPASRFTVAPILTMNTGDGHVTVGPSTITATSATVTICNYTTAASVAATGQWQAVQMTSAAAAG